MGWQLYVFIILYDIIFITMFGQALHRDILQKKPDFSDVTEVASELMGLVGEEEAGGLADRLQDTADRYAALVDASDLVGQLLQQSCAGLRHLVLTYQDLQAWMEGMERRLGTYRLLAVHTEKLLEQMDDLAVSSILFHYH